MQFVMHTIRKMHLIMLMHLIFVTCKFYSTYHCNDNCFVSPLDFSIQLSSMARDMCTEVRIEAFNALAKMQRVSEGVLLQSLSKKIIKTDTGSASSIKGKKLPPKLSFPCAAGIFAHGVEDEFYQVRSFSYTT